MRVESWCCFFNVRYCVRSFFLCSLGVNLYWVLWSGPVTSSYFSMTTSSPYTKDWNHKNETSEDAVPTGSVMWHRSSCVVRHPAPRGRRRISRHSRFPTSKWFKVVLRGCLWIHGMSLATDTGVVTPDPRIKSRTLLHPTKKEPMT